jgi:septal ring factor EnvC (AmiA/AmiB activator)
VAAYRDTLVQLRAATTSLEERGARLQALQQQAVTARQAAARAVANRAALVAEIDARRDLNAQLIGELQAAAERLGSLAPAAVSSASVILPIRPFRGDLDWPAAGRLAARFGRQRDARFGTTVLRSGVSIAAPPGSPARAVHEGVVAYAEPFPGYGNLVILDHGSQAYSLYGYLGTIDAQKGARVNRGQAVGTIGTAPAGGAELYFELRIDGKPVEPVQWLKQR